MTEISAVPALTATRRGLGRTALGLLLLAGIRPAMAGSNRADIPDVAVFCDATLRPALRKVADQFGAHTGAPIHLFSAPPPLMLQQIARFTQTDLLITRTSDIDAGVTGGMVKPGTKVAIGHNVLVIAGVPGTPIGTDIAGLVGNGRFAVTDPTAATSIDGPAVLAALGLTDALAPRLISAANTDEVAFLVTSGAARLGLLHRTDVVADSRLAIVMPVPETAYPPIAYSGGVALTVASPNAKPFLDFLVTPEARETMRKAGVESAT